MMNVTIIGIGAAGNKAAIKAITNKVIKEDHVKLINTTVKDIPEEYVNKKMYFQIPTPIGGAGKESNKAKQAMINALNNGNVDPKELLNEDSKAVILVSSVEGGTGSGAVPVLAEYYTSKKIPTHVFAIIGFQDEARGINNTLKFFRDLPDNVVLHTICNQYFLDYTKNYKIAEEAANNEFSNQIAIIKGNMLIDTDQVIDDMDLFKINSTPGYMTINKINIQDIRNIDNFNAAVSQAFDNSCHIQPDQSAKRIAGIINADPNIQKFVDNKLDVLQRYIGVAFEKFLHIQNDGTEDYIIIICCGMNYPEKAIRDLFKDYNKIKEKLNTGLKSFGEIFEDITVDEEDEFNIDFQMGNIVPKQQIFNDNSSDISKTTPKKSEDKVVKVVQTNKVKNMTEEY